MSDSSPRSTAEELSQKYWEWRLENYPEHATVYGYAGDHFRWMDLSAEAREQRKDWFKSFLKEVEGLDEQSLNRDLLQYEISTRLEQNKYPSEFLSLTTMGGPHTICAQMIPLMSKNTAGDFEDILARIASFPKYLEQSTELLRQGSGALPLSVLDARIREWVSRALN